MRWTGRRIAAVTLLASLSLQLVAANAHAHNSPPSDLLASQVAAADCGDCANEARPLLVGHCLRCRGPKQLRAALPARDAALDEHWRHQCEGGLCDRSQNALDPRHRPAAPRAPPARFSL
jgi:bacterioferritin-associated ferredoxin